jgi:hypothetical protein
MTDLMNLLTCVAGFLAAMTTFISNIASMQASAAAGDMTQLTQDQHRVAMDMRVRSACLTQQRYALAATLIQRIWRLRQELLLRQSLPLVHVTRRRTM